MIIFEEVVAAVVQRIGSSQLPLALGSEWFVPRDALGSAVPAVPWLPGGPRGLPLVPWRDSPRACWHLSVLPWHRTCCCLLAARLLLDFHGNGWRCHSKGRSLRCRDQRRRSSCGCVPTSARTRDCGPSICHRPNCPLVVLLQRECDPPSCGGLILSLYEGSDFLRVLPRHAVVRTPAQDTRPRCPGCSSQSVVPAFVPRLAWDKQTSSPGTAPARAPGIHRNISVSLARWLEM